MRRDVLLMCMVVISAGLSAVGQAQPPATPARAEGRVKTTTERLSSGRTVKGVVGKIDTKGMTLVEVNQATVETKEHHLLPIDHLLEGKVLSDVNPRFAYRWKDVKEGDTVELYVAEDHVDKRRYCLEIAIERRPKGKLPPSQLEGEDKYYPWHRIFNDIENGEDVSDEEIKKAFPPRPERRDHEGRLLRSATPGGLGAEYQKKLDAIRAKKKEQEKDPKAAPPGKE